jgi:thioredoxin reductase (NADPH)
MREQAESFGATYIHEKVQGVNLSGEMKTIITNDMDFKAPAIIIATGSMGRGQRVPGEDRLLGWGVSYCATCDAAFFRDQTVAVVGTSDEAITEALFLTKFVRHVEFFCPTPQIKAPLEMVEEIMAHPAIRVHLGTALKEVVGDQKVEGVRVAPRGAAARIVPVTGAFIYLQGAKPITDFVQGQIETSDAGCLLRVDREYQTTMPGVYAVGDVLCDHVKQAVVAAAEGAVAAMAVEKHLHGRKQLAVDWSK